MRGRITENGATGDCDEMDLDANGASVPGSPGCFDSALSTPDVQKPRSDCETLKTLENVSLEPVGPSQGGEGFPYAPGEWPNPGDKWKWKVGRRRTASGFWADRYLILPKTLQRGKKQAWFTSKNAVEKYLKKSFPDADHQTFFASFEWQIPCTPLSLASAEDNNEGVIAYDVKRLREPDSICDGQTPVKIHCKAGNAKCRLETGKGKFFNALDCDICCVESGFCRECSCILCGKSIDQELGEYYFVQCEGNQGEDVICGHVAHLECAVICQTAGVVRSIGLDVEYYCRRCDKKTDLLKHVLGLIPTPELSKTGADFESNLNLALRLVQGTQQLGARILENLFQKAVKKLQSGMQLQDIFGDLRYSSVTVNAGKVDSVKENIPSLMQPSSNTPILLTKLGCKAGIHSSPVSISAATNEGADLDYGIRSASRTMCSDLLQSRTLAPDMSSEKGNACAHDHLKKTRLLSEDTRRASDLQNLPDYIRALKLENMVFQSLHMLRQSQETEFKLAQEKLFAQKDFVLSLFQQLEGTSCEFANNPSPSLENSAEKEHEKFVNMLAIANGFGSTPKGFLHHYFGIG